MDTMGASLISNHTVRIKIGCILLLWWPLTFNGQTAKKPHNADSIYAVWNSLQLPPAERFNALYRYNWDDYLFAKPDTALILAELLEQFAIEHQLIAEQAKSYNLKGIAFSLLGKTSEALLNYEKTAAIRKQVNDKKGLSSVLANIGIIYADMGYYRKAMGYYTSSLALKEELNDNQGIIVSHNNLGNVYQKTGELEKALYHFNEARRRIELHGHPKMVAQSSLNIANVYFSNGFYAQAYQYFHEALTYFKSTNENKGHANVLNNLGLLYSRLSNYSKAIEMYEESYALFDEMNYPSGKAMSLINIGNLHNRLSKTPEAKAAYEKALAIYTEIDDKQGQSSVHFALGDMQIAEGMWEEALRHIESCINLQKSLENPKGVLSAKAQYGYVLTLQGKVGLGLVILLEAYQQAKENKYFAEIKLLSDYLFATYKMGEPAKAVAYVHQKTRMANEALKRNYFHMSENDKELYFKTIYHDYNDLLAFAVRNGQQFPELKDSMLNTVLMIKGLSLKSTASMRNTIYESGDTLLIHDFENWLNVKKEIIKEQEIGNPTEELEVTVQLSEQSLILRSTAIQDFNNSFFVNWKNVQRNLSSKEAVVEFIQYSLQVEDKTTTRYAAVVVKKKSKHPEIIPLCEERELIDFLSDYRGNNLNYVKSIYGTLNQPQINLSRLIWNPIAPRLKNIKTIYYSPIGLLHKVCFAALADEQGKLLLDSYALRLLNSTSQLAQQKPDYSSLDINNALLLGGIDYQSGTTNQEVWKYLPGTLTEIQSIQSIISKEDKLPLVLVGGEADESTVKKEVIGKDIIHISTHGYFYPDPELIRQEMKQEIELEIEDIDFRGSVPVGADVRTGGYANWNFVNNKNPLMRSGLVLAGANDVWQREALSTGEDGVLTAQEVANLNLHNTKLVVLSACETGLGDSKGSEGVYGLQRAFKMAGVQCLIMSLWQVPDRETAEFMVLFYQNLIRHKDLYTSFDFTQKTMRTKYDPYYWGAFVLIR
jgi:CHAT domain-containing protein/tetratricopeptide (TPR) repeat protein